MKMKIHNLHIDILLFRETTAHVMHHTQVQAWTRLGLLSTVKIHTGSFDHIHLLLPYRVTEADATPHS